MRLTKEFTEGKIADRLLCAIQNCEATAFLRLKRQGHFRADPQEYVVTLPALKYASFSAYVKATNVHAHDIIYGGEVRENLYTEDDDIIIEFINSLTVKQQQKLLDQIEVIFPKDLFRSMRGLRTIRIIYHFIGLLPYGYMTRIAENDNTVPRYEYLSEDALVQLARLKKSRNEGAVIPTDVIPSIASFLGVSLHFIWGLDVPLYCNTQEGDLLFDYYTLMNTAQRKTFIDIVSCYTNRRRGHKF